MNPEAKERLTAVLGLVRTVFQWGYIPAIVYLGIKKGADPGCPEVSIYRLEYFDKKKALICALAMKLMYPAIKMQAEE